ncbi:hypothetical protein GMOD_00008306 [Pyrenophora seminiperda CCB06]|uniref:Uncharacterized protein n=1 Tax=Pyrenophora seminiperda CCB06 TaxID=1302712 RepID=A0A3M7M2G6_9PLEO|nr:hypothetical protein GMOD_00008306 [Pyrenophora seminiperda CCB06]
MHPSPYFDPLHETEPNTTIYTLTVYVPQRPPPSWIPAFFTRKPVRHANTGSTYKLPPSDRNKDLNCFEHWDLDELPTKTVTIQSAWFPAEMRCAHVQESKVCEEGCYFLEKGGRVARWFCKREGCEGHVYCGRVREDELQKSCFGKEGARLVCIRRGGE